MDYSGGPNILTNETKRKMASNTTAWINFRMRNRIDGKMRLMRRRINRTFRSIRADIRKTIGVMRVMNKQMHKMGSGAISKLPFAGMLSGAGLLYGGKQALETAAGLESMETAIRHISGTAEEGDKNMKFLMETSRELGIDVDVASDGFKRLLASTRGIKSMESTRKMFYNMSVGIRGMGLSAQSSESIFYALSEMFSKSTVMAQELKLQLGNSLPSAYRTMVEAVGKGMKKFRKMMKAGEVSAAKYVEKFTELIKRDYIGALDDAKKTASYKLALLSYDWKITMQDIGDTIAGSGILENMNIVLLVVSKWIKENKKLIGLKLKEWVMELAKAGMYLVDHWDEIWLTIKMVTKAFILFKGVLVMAALPALLSNPLTAAALAIGTMVVAMPTLIELYRTFTKEVSKGKEELSGFELALIGIGDMMKSIFNENKNTAFERLKLLVVSITELVWGLELGLWKLLNLVGLTSDSGYAKAKVDYGKETAELREWALGTAPVASGAAMSEKERDASGYFASEKKDERKKISPYVTGQTLGDKIVTNESVLYIKGASELMDRLELDSAQSAYAAKIILSNADNLPYER